MGNRIVLERMTKLAIPLLTLFQVTSLVLQLASWGIYVLMEDNSCVDKHAKWTLVGIFAIQFATLTQNVVPNGLALRFIVFLTLIVSLIRAGYVFQSDVECLPDDEDRGTRYERFVKLDALVACAVTLLGVFTIGTAYSDERGASVEMAIDDQNLNDIYKRLSFSTIGFALAVSLLNIGAWSVYFDVSGAQCLRPALLVSIGFTYMIFMIVARLLHVWTSRDTNTKMNLVQTNWFIVSLTMALCVIVWNIWDEFIVSECTEALTHADALEKYMRLLTAQAVFTTLMIVQYFIQVVLVQIGQHDSINYKLVLSGMQ